jgi:hypothetical protein
MRLVSDSARRLLDLTLEYQRAAEILDEWSLLMSDGEGPRSLDAIAADYETALREITNPAG